MIPLTAQETGGPAIAFDPLRVVAAAGDTITFVRQSLALSPLTRQAFDRPGTHAAVEGNPSKPCEPVPGGFTSGTQTGVQGAGPRSVYNVTSSDPVMCVVATSATCNLAGAATLSSCYLEVEFGS